MGATRMTETPIEEKVVAFFRDETFYLVFVALAVFMAGFLTLYPPPAVFAPPSLAKLEGHFASAVGENTPFASAVVHTRAVLLISGTVLALALAALWVVRGRLLQPRIVHLPPWGLWDTFKIGAIFSVAGLLVFPIVFGIYDPRVDYDRGSLMSSLFAQITLVALVLYMVRDERHGRLSQLGLKRNEFGYNIVLGVAGFLVVLPMLLAVGRVLSFLQHNFLMEPLPVQEAVWRVLRTPWSLMWLVGVLVVLIVPLAEELFFRGMLAPALQRWFGRTMAIMLSAVFFAAAHVDLVALVPMFLMGLVLGYLYDRRRSLVPCVAMHVLYNGVVFLDLLAHKSVGIGA